MTATLSMEPGFSTTAMASVWTPAAKVAAVLEFEAALALGLADAGLAPQDEAAAVADACGQPVPNPEAILASTWETGTPLLALIAELEKRLPGDDQRRWIHHGATTQDAIDTAHMLQSARSLDLLEVSAIKVAKLLRTGMDRHRDQPQMGRTFLQHARPTTFGMRIGFWLETVLRHIEDLRRARSVLAVQLGGPVGNRAEYGAAAEQLVESVARRLGLQASVLAWHTDRSRIWQLVSTVEQAVASMAKIALDLALLAQSDVAEVALRPGGSSSMAGKRNPLDAIRALAAADACRAAASMITGGRPHELDRGIGSWHAEWFALPFLFHTAAATFEATEDLLGGMDLDTSMMGSRVPADTEIPQAIADQIDKVASMYDQVIGA